MRQTSKKFIDSKNSIVKICQTSKSGSIKRIWFFSLLLLIGAVPMLHADGVKTFKKEPIDHYEDDINFGPGPAD